MYHVCQDDLPFKGSSHQFVGADNGDVSVSVYLLSAMPGRRPRHARIGIRTTKSSSCDRGADDGTSTRFIQEDIT